MSSILTLFKNQLKHLFKTKPNIHPMAENNTTIVSNEEKNKFVESIGVLEPDSNFVYDNLRETLDLFEEFEEDNENETVQPEVISL
mgnify:CR=1 FL=1|tara:strand:- start:12171 stop:12428 length:258 start_codon:yes stop_codon:yes gene_type:complete